MIELNRLNEAISAAENKAESAAISKCFNRELTIWILKEIKDILYKQDGSRRMSLFVSKGMLIAFVVKLGIKLAGCLVGPKKKLDPEDAINQ